MRTRIIFVTKIDTCPEKFKVHLFDQIVEISRKSSDAFSFQKERENLNLD